MGATGGLVAVAVAVFDVEPCEAAARVFREGVRAGAKALDAYAELVYAAVRGQSPGTAGPATG